RRLESSGLGLAEAFVLGPAFVVEAGEDGDAIGMRPLPALHLRHETLAPSPVEVDDGFDAGFIEDRQQLVRRAGGPGAAERRTEVVVGIDRRYGRPGHRSGKHTPGT